MADSECRPHTGHNRSTSPTPRQSATTPMTPAAVSHIPMAHGGGNHIPMNMRAAITESERNMILDSAMDKLYRKYPCPPVQSQDPATTLASSINHPIPMTQESMARTPSSMTPGELVTEDEQNIDKMYRKFPCPTCFKGFKSKQQLIQHNLVHSGTRKYHCSYCDKSFKQLCHLQQHHRIHTGEKPYKCTLGECDRQFAQLSNLQHHLRNHDDQVKKAANRQHACVICHRSYTNESSLKSHTLKMHVHIKPVSPNVDSLDDTPGKSHKHKNKLPIGIYSPPTMVPIHRMSSNEECKVMQKDETECGKNLDKLLRKTKDDGCQPIVIDLETSGGSSGHSPYRSSSYRYTSNKDLPHLNTSNNPAVTLADSHISSSAPSRQEQDEHTQSNIAHHPPSYTDVHEQLRTFPQVLGLAPQGVSFISSPNAHHHPITEALTNAQSENYKLYYSQDHNRMSSSSPLPPVGTITSTSIQATRPPRLNIPTNSVNENMSQALSFTPLRP